MATSTATVLVNVITQTKGAVDGLDKMSGKMGKFQGAMRSAMVPAAAAGAVLVGFGVAAGKAASDAEQAFGGVDAVFKRNADVVKRWADSAANDVGLAKDEYATLATLIGGQLKAAGLPLDEATRKTKTLISTGADLAATFGGTTKQAVEALSSAMRGEADPAEQFNLNLKEGMLNSQMLADETARLTKQYEQSGKGAKSQAQMTELAKKSLAKMTPEAKNAARAHALLAQVEKQSADSRNMFAKEADTAANQQQKAAANWRNALIDLGAVLLPLMTKAASLLSKVAVWMQKNQSVVIALAAAIGILVIAVLAVNAALWAMSLTPVTLIIAAVVVAVLALVVGLTMLYKRSETARKIMDAVWRGIKSGFKAVAKFLVATVKGWLPVFKAVFAAIKGYVQIFFAYVKLVFNVIKGVIKLVVAVFKGDWRGAFAAVRGILSSFKEFFRSVWNVLRDPVMRLVEIIKDKMSDAISSIKGKMAGLGQVLAAPFNTAKDAIGFLIDKIGDLISWLGRIKIPDLGKLGGLVSKVTGRSAAAPPVAGGVSGYAAPRVAGVGARAATSGGSGVTIQVNGALDPEAVARQIKRIMAGHDRRIGLSVA